MSVAENYCFSTVYTVSTSGRWVWGEEYNLLIFGGPCRDRTCGPLIKSQLLYQLS